MLENLGLVEVDQLKLLTSRFVELEENGALDAYKKDVTAEKASREQHAKNAGPFTRQMHDEERVVLHEGNAHSIDEYLPPSLTDADDVETGGRGVSQGCGPGNALGFMKPC